MMYHDSQQLPSTILKVVYYITTYSKSIGNFWTFVSDLVGRAKNKSLHKQFISNGYKY